MKKKKTVLDNRIKIWIYDEIFDAVYFVQINGKPSDSIEHFLKKTKAFFYEDACLKFFRDIKECDDEAHRGGWFINWKDVPVCYIWLKQFANGALVHETHHAVSHVLTSKGIPRCNETEEVYAYVHDWLCRTIINRAYKQFDKLGAK